MLIAEVLKGDGQLTKIAHALRARGRLTHLLHGRQEQADQDGDDGDDHQQLDQREATPPALREDPWHAKTPENRDEAVRKNNTFIIAPKRKRDYLRSKFSFSS